MWSILIKLLNICPCCFYLKYVFSCSFLPWNSHTAPCMTMCKQACVCVCSWGNGAVIIKSWLWKKNVIYKPGRSWRNGLGKVWRRWTTAESSVKWSRVVITPGSLCKFLSYSWFHKSNRGMNTLKQWKRWIFECKDSNFLPLPTLPL